MKLDIDWDSPSVQEWICLCADRIGADDPQLGIHQALDIAQCMRGLERFRTLSPAVAALLFLDEMSTPEGAAKFAADKEEADVQGWHAAKPARVNLMSERLR